ncbi:MAG: SIMPL domain-containing protein [Aquabacterium sp.]|nr:SIMPL domain-containing protein [Aquabacterium sp.]
MQTGFPSRPKLSRAVAGSLVAATLALASAGSRADTGPTQNVVRFSTSATQEVTQDLLSITLQATREGSQAAEVQAGLKQVMESALAEARKSAQGQGMEVRTGAFSVQPRYNSSGRINGWQGFAQLVLEGTDIARITQATGRLNQLNVISVNYGLSRALREQYESSLTSQAIARFKTRASQIAADFGMKGFTLGDISVSSTDPGFEPRPFMVKAMAMRAEAADAPLPVEPGKGVLSVTVNGQVNLTP